MVDVARMPAHAFGSVPTPAIVAPLEFTMRLADYRAMGGHMDYVKPLDQAMRTGSYHVDGAPRALQLLPDQGRNPWPTSGHSMLG